MSVWLWKGENQIVPILKASYLIPDQTSLAFLQRYYFSFCYGNQLLQDVKHFVAIVTYHNNLSKVKIHQLKSF